MNIVFEVPGGIGKNIAATVIVELIKNKYPDSNLTVLASNPEIFQFIPYIDELDNIKNRKFYIDKGHDYDKVMVLDPYHHSDMITKKKHLIEVWANLYDLDYNDEIPNLHLPDELYAEAQKFEVFEKKRPIMVLHPNGGTETELYNYNWSRDIPANIVNKIVEKYKDEYDIYHIKGPKQRISYDNTIVADGDMISIAKLLLKSDKRIFIDSFAQHMATALNLPSTVCWVTTSPNEFGYELHNNIIRNEYEVALPYTCYEGFSLIEPLVYMPYRSTDSIFNEKQILNNI